MASEQFKLKLSRLAMADDELEAVEAVKSVLTFLTFGCESGLNLHGVKQAETGLGIILQTCVDTLTLSQEK